MLYEKIVRNIYNYAAVIKKTFKRKNLFKVFTQVNLQNLILVCVYLALKSENKCLK